MFLEELKAEVGMGDGNSARPPAAVVKSRAMRSYSMGFDLPGEVAPSLAICTCMLAFQGVRIPALEGVAFVF